MVGTVKPGEQLTGERMMVVQSTFRLENRRIHRLSWEVPPELVPDSVCEVVESLDDEK